MAAVIDRAYAQIEAGHPILLGAAGGVFALAYGPVCIDYMVGLGWAVPNIYSAVFDVSAIVTPFLFTFYSFVMTTDRGFIGRAKGSIYYRMANRFTIRALILGGLLTVGSIPMMVIEPTPVTRFGWEHFLIVAWVVLAIWTIAAFVRAAYIFSIFARHHS